MKPMKKTEVLIVAEGTASASTLSHVHGKRTRIFLKDPVVTTNTVTLLKEVVLTDGVLEKTYETITYVTGITFTGDRAVVDILTPDASDVNE